ncbi:MAG: hypothetical protein IPG58_19340 [Acidobacteria bacterium]|nr:hypothetical protein [Acidobacteriota bacterium]MBP7475216.1 hypothetical protein [Pyrinomonadaceae bacterium]
MITRSISFTGWHELIIVQQVENIECRDVFTLSRNFLLGHRGLLNHRRDHSRGLFHITGRDAVVIVKVRVV